jgi:TolA-binding protein
MGGRRAAPAPPVSAHCRALSVPCVAVVLTCGVAAAVPSLAEAQSLGEVQRQLAHIEDDARQLGTIPLRASQLRSATYVEERLTDGELFLRLKDYVRASIIFTDIVDNHKKHRAHSDALYLLGESLFHAGDYLGARRRFRIIIDRAGEGAYRPYVQRALGRLIEIAIHIRDFDRVEEYFQKLSRMPTQPAEASAAYFRAKYLFSRAVPGDPATGEGAPPGPAQGVDLALLEEARRTFAGVGPASPYHIQARYFIGVIHTLRAELPEAIAAFQAVRQVQASGAEQQRVAHLAHLALGRLYYETNRIPLAVEAYHAVPRTSPLFDTALYEAAWAYIRLGDSTRAERALEVLSVAVPESPHIPDAQLLRGNLLLRNGRLDDANRVFVEIRDRFAPVRRQLEQMIADKEDVQAYFRQLVRHNLAAFDAAALLPDDARRWAAVDGDMDRALTALRDLSQARQLLAETRELVLRLDAAVSAPNRRNVFGDLRRHQELVTGIRNRLAQVRRALMAIEDSRTRGGAGGELGQVRAERRRIEATLGQMPTGANDFAMRDDAVRGRYKGLERELKSLQVELLGIEARVTATERYLSDTASERDPQGLQAVRRELEQQRGAVDGYRERIAELGRLVEAAKLQVGVGDAQHQRDDQLRRQYNDLVARERQLLAAAGMQRAADLDGLFGRVAKVESHLDAHEAKVEAIADQRLAELGKVLAEERTNLESYRQRLAELEDESEVVVGGIALESYNAVRKRFYDLILRADVGRIDVAWSRREEHRTRVDLLTRERSRELQALDEEFREIMDERPAPEEAE